MASAENRTVNNVLSEGEYARQLANLGRRVHEHDQVWWVANYPLYARPAFEYREIVPGTARPQFWRCLLGYSHQVPDARQGNRVLELFVLQGSNLREFSLARIRPEKRSQIRKGLRSCTVALLTDLQPQLECLREASLSQAIRHAQQGKYSIPPQRYTKDVDAWRARCRLEFAQKGREWWVALVEGRLVACMVTFQVETTRVIQKMITHTDFLRLNVTDALYFTVLQEVSRMALCHRIINGGPLHSGNDRYKELFLFVRTPVPYYSSHPALFQWGVRLISTRRALRVRLKVFDAANNSTPFRSWQDRPCASTSARHRSP